MEREVFVIVTNDGTNYGDFKSFSHALSWAKQHLIGGSFQIAPIRRPKDFDYDKPREKLHFVA